MQSQLIGKDSQAGEHRRQEEKGMTEDDIVGWHHPLDGYETEQAPAIGDIWEPGVLQSLGSQRVR